MGTAVASAGADLPVAGADLPGARWPRARGTMLRVRSIVALSFPAALLPLPTAPSPRLLPRAVTTEAPLALDLARMLERVQERQWALADIDWDAPGADRITVAQRPALASFMADVTWIEQLGARAFAALARKAEDPLLADLYRYFHAEEQRHANAELALMKRWDMLEDGPVPEPAISIRLAMDWLDRFADTLPLPVLGSAIPMLEVALDGALLKFLTEAVPDPLCRSVFERINSDESRHLAVGFHVLELIGRDPWHRHARTAARVLLSPAVIASLPAAMPLFSRARADIVSMGLEERQLAAALARFEQAGSRQPAIRRNPSYLVLNEFAKMVANRSHPYHLLADAVGEAVQHWPRRLLRRPPAWAGELTAEPVV